MEFYSLLDSYGYVVYENKNTFWKKFSEKYFFDRWNFWNFKNFEIFEKIWKSNIKKLGKWLKCEFLNPKIQARFFLIDRKIFFDNFFFKTFFIFVNYMNIAFYNAIGRHLTPSGRWERAFWIFRKSKKTENLDTY